MLLIQSDSLDVYRNLALEEYLMDEVHQMGPILFLWRSSEAVVMGKNQNPWRECRLDLMEREEVPLARRASGGGTVYHDQGNLNYCVITSREAYDEKLAYNLVFGALASFGLTAQKTGKSNLSVGGLKFSGNAFAFRNGRAMHHGTLLVDSDLVKLNRYLGAVDPTIETRAIASVPATVTNLAIPLVELIAALRSEFIQLYGAGEAVVEWSDTEVGACHLEERMARQVSDEWVFGKTPKFSIQLGLERVEVVRGVVQSGEHEGRSFRKAYSRID